MKGVRLHLKIHIVQKGDTLWELSKKYGVNFEELKDMNSHIASPDLIMPGMKIRIPTNAKVVRKEAPVQQAPIQQAPVQPKVEQPYKDITPKPLPVIEEDDQAPIMEIKPEMPIPQMPQIPQMPMMPQMTQIPQMQPVKEAPTTMEQELNTYMMFNFPDVHITEESSKDESVHHVKQQPIQQPMFQPMHHHMHMMPCFPIHPCCAGMPLGHHMVPMHHPHMLPHHMGNPGQVMPLQDDCGCGGGGMPQSPTMDMMQPFGFDPFMGMQNQAYQMPNIQMNPSAPFTPDTSGFPTPPGFGELRNNIESESSD